MRWLLGSALLLCACAGTEDADSAPPPSDARREVAPIAPTPATDLERFRREHDYLDGRIWVTFDVTKSHVTETRRRIYYEKEAVTRALLAHAETGTDAAPLSYPDGSAFVAEALDEGGARIDTEVLVTRSERLPDFLLFDEVGARSDTFALPAGSRVSPGNVPRACIGCHAGRDYFRPMDVFPDDEGERRLDVDPAYRDREVVLLLLEGYHRGEGLFGPYGSLWLAKLKHDALRGRLSVEDRAHYERLIEVYPDVLPWVER